MLVAEADADPWWNDLPTGYDGMSLKPLSGAPAEIAEELMAYRREGIAHIQLTMDSLTIEAVERFAPVLELIKAQG